MPKQLLLNTPSIGSWITLGHPAIAEIMAESGFDWLTVDLEHSTITIREAEDLIRIIELKGVIPLVRLTSNSSEQIKRVMDAGAHGVVVPMVCSGDDARAAVSAVRYPPVGKRGVGLARAQGYGSSFEMYRSWQENEAIVVVQVEHIDAVNNLEEILDLVRILDKNTQDISKLIKEIREKTVYNIGESAKVGAEYIKQLHNESKNSTNT